MGTNLPFTFAPKHFVPRSECTANAKSKAVEPIGKIFISPFGVNIKTSLEYRLSFMLSSNSVVDKLC